MRALVRGESLGSVCGLSGAVWAREERECVQEDDIVL